MKKHERTRRACRPGSSTDTYSLQLRIVVNDSGRVILDETRTGVCDRRVRQQKFMATYIPEDCAGGVPPIRRSTNEITVTAMTEDGTLVESRILKCKK
jgi:hypothetical protein